MFDADGSTDPAEITRFVDALKAGADFAKGSRFTAGGGSADITPLRRLGNRFLNGVFNVAFRTRYTDLCYGYNAFWADLLPLLDLPDHSAPAPANGGCCGATASRSRPSSTAGSPRRGSRSPRSPRSSSCGCSASRTCTPSPDGLRVPRTLFTEWRRARAPAGSSATWTHPRALVKGAPAAIRTSQAA